MSLIAFCSNCLLSIKLRRLCSAVSSDNQADAYLGPTNPNAFVDGNRGRGLRKWAIASSCGTCHLPHVDANGLSTVVTIHEGYKLWVWGERRANSPLPTPLPEQTTAAKDSDSWHWALFKDCLVYSAVLGPNDTM